MNRPGSRDITTRNDIACDISAGFAAVTPALTGAWRLIDSALADLPAARSASTRPAKARPTAAN